MPYLTLPIKYLLLLLVLGLFSVRSQTTGFNPFSRYAFGELAPIGGSAQQALAASGIALQTDTLPPTLVNMVNPAAWSDLRYTALDIGSDLQFQRIQQRSALNDYSNVRFLNATLALPLKKHGGLVLGIMPYSQSGYNLTQTLTAAAGTCTQNVQAFGGWNRAVLGFGLHPFPRRLLAFKYRNLYVPDSSKHHTGFAYAWRKTSVELLSQCSFGVQASWLFGTLDQISRFVYPNSNLYSNTLSRNALSVNGYLVQGGLQTGFTLDSSLFKTQRRPLQQPIRIGFGYTYQVPTPIHPVQELDVYSYILNGAGAETIRDTLSSTLQILPINAPLEQGFGLGIKRGEQWQWHADVHSGDWSKIMNPTQNIAFEKSMRYATGIYYQPDKLAFGKGTYFKRVVYRAGLQYQTGPLRYQGTLVTDWNVNLGLSLPLAQNRLFNTANLSFRIGQNGIPGYQTTYVRIFLGCTFQDRWFLKYKYD